MRVGAGEPGENSLESSEHGGGKKLLLLSHFGVIMSWEGILTDRIDNVRNKFLGKGGSIMKSFRVVGGEFDKV